MRLKVLLAGYGAWGANLARCVHALPGVALAAIADTGRPARGRAAQDFPAARVFASVPEALAAEPFHAAVIATPPETHVDLATAAITASCDVFVEKPLALSAAAGRGLARLCAQSGRIVMAGHLMRYHPAIGALREALRSGALGPLVYMTASRLNATRPQHEGSALWALAPHDIALMADLCGEAPEAVSAVSGARPGMHPHDIVFLVLRFPGGCRGQIHVSRADALKTRRFTVTGARRMVIFDDMEPVHKLRLYGPVEPGYGAGAGGAAEDLPFAAGEPLRAELQHFFVCVQERKEPLSGVADGVMVAAVLEAAEASLAQGGAPQAVAL